MSDGFKFNYNETAIAIADVSNNVDNLFKEIKEISNIINTDQQDWQGTTKEAYVNKLMETKQELENFIDTTFTEYMSKEKIRLSEHADDEGANVNIIETLAPGI